MELRRAPRWQLALPGRPAGQVLRALAWLGPEEAERAVRRLRRDLPPPAFQELAAVASRLPAWLARTITREAVRA